jgi:hypothetical protein
MRAIVCGYEVGVREYFSMCEKIFFLLKHRENGNNHYMLQAWSVVSYNQNLFINMS